MTEKEEEAVLLMAEMIRGYMEVVKILYNAVDITKLPEGSLSKLAELGEKGLRLQGMDL